MEREAPRFPARHTRAPPCRFPRCVRDALGQSHVRAQRGLLRLYRRTGLGGIAPRSRPYAGEVLRRSPSARPGPSGGVPARRRERDRPVPGRAQDTLCSNICRVTATLHRSGDFLPSTSWGPRSCPDGVHRLPWGTEISAAQLPVDWWTVDLHRLWRRRRSTACGWSCPLPTHSLRPVVPSELGLLHIPVHCSATRRGLSPARVKAVTPRCWIGLWERWVKLGTALGRSAPRLCTECAELSVLHRDPGLSTGPAHRARGQNFASDLGKRRYPRFPQALLLLPTRETGNFASKWVLCTTRCPASGCPASRLDPDRRLLSVRCVRLFPGVLPLPGAPDTESDDEGQAGRERRQQQEAA
ncbi:hypothetical protein BX257_4710 [Streptomyces sp. 3212.3]|nr:hypothetical protein BX257_4710 [Streptomyces sp. 3212.3]